MAEQQGNFYRNVLFVALIVMGVGMTTLILVTSARTSDVLDQITEIEQQQVEAQARSDVAAAERQQIVTDLECFARNSTDFYLVVSDLLIFNLNVDLQGPSVTDEQRESAEDALARLEEFKAKAEGEALDCAEAG